MLTVYPDSGSFYRLAGLPSKANNWVKYSVPQEYRYFEFEDNLGYWYVHQDHLLGAVEVAYCQQGVVDYSRVPIDLQMDIARAKENWVFSKTSSKEVTSNTSVFDAYSTLYLHPTAPFSVVVSVWRTLAKESHPDKGGDIELFKKYSKAYETIKKETK